MDNSFWGSFSNAQPSADNSNNSNYNQPTQNYNSQYNETPPNNNVNSDIENFLRSQKAKIKVVGIGGGGNNALNRINEVGISGVEVIAINTDAQDLLNTYANKKILIGKEITRGMGAGSNPSVGEEAARESEREIRDALDGADMVFLTCGLGGGTGSGSISVVAEQAKKTGALVICVVTLPFEMEGHSRFENATYGLDRLDVVSDTIIVIPNDKLLQLAPDLPLQTAFKISDEILTNAVKGIAELVTKPGLINLDFADINSIMEDGGVALIGIGESNSNSRAEEAISKAVNNPILDADISGANGALINVCGGSSLTLKEAKDVVETISEKLSPDSKVIWGARIDESLEDKLQIMLIVTGVTSPQILGNEIGKLASKNPNSNELGIDFL